MNNAEYEASPVAMTPCTLTCGLTEFKDGEVFADIGKCAGRPIDGFTRRVTTMKARIVVQDAPEDEAGRKTKLP